MNKFYPLKIKSIRNLTSDAVEFTFYFPEGLKDKFIFEPGQYITIKHLINGEEISMEQSGLSKREWNELMEAFDLKDKLI